VNRLLLMASCAVVIPGSSSALADRVRPAIVIGGDLAYPPYEFLDNDGKPAGFNVELTYAIAEVAGLTVEIRLGAWDEMRRALEHGELDAMEGVVHSPGRESVFDFSPPHSTIHQSVFGRIDAAPVTDLAQLRGKAVIVQRGGIMHDYLVENRVGATLILVETHVAAMRLLASGKHDYALVANLPGLYLGREYGLHNIRSVGKLFGGQPYGYAVRKGNTALLAQLSEGLAIVKNTGRYQEIYNRWLGSLEPSGVLPAKLIKYGLLVIVPLLLVLGATVLWSRTLQRRVLARTDELKVRDQQLRQADRLASLGTLVSGVAHEINNPTGLILLSLPVLRRAYQAAETVLEARYQQDGDFMIGGLSYGELRDEMPRVFQDMTEGARRIKRIVEELKDFARDGKPTLDQRVDLNTVVEVAARLVDAQIKTATVDFRMELAAELPAFQGNPQGIEQVVVNLLQNACHALPDPQRGIRIATSVDPERKTLTLVVEDRGIGIPADQLARVTDPFFTTRREHGGTGLGLSMSAKIIREHLGTMAFRSSLGDGTTVIVTLPAASAPA